MKSIIITALITGAIVMAYEEFNSVGPIVQVIPAPTKQIVPIGSQPKDPTKPWCYEQKSGNSTVIVCG
jgi:hypothetical protein